MSVVGLFWAQLQCTYHIHAQTVGQPGCHGAVLDAEYSQTEKSRDIYAPGML
jgi:hypothetical protein